MGAFPRVLPCTQGVILDRELTIVNYNMQGHDRSVCMIDVVFMEASNLDRTAQRL